MTDTITITGNIATPPEEKRTAAGLVITTFRVASSQRRFDRATNQWIDGETNWYTVSAFRALAEHAYLSLRKGERVIVTGRLHLREWETNAKKGTTAEIDADAIGHDLLWGTSVFSKRSVRRAEPAVGPARDAEWSVAPIPDGEGTDAWTTPMAEVGDRAAEVEPTEQRELADSPL